MGIVGSNYDRKLVTWIDPITVRIILVAKSDSLTEFHKLVLIDLIEISECSFLYEIYYAINIQARGPFQ